jgi:citrate/tricarballylate utilization protein
MSTTALNALIAEVQSGHMVSSASVAESEVARQMQICNACRYCEGFCAVFPAMTRRLDFSKDDIHYLANLCHNCGACLHACQYAPPHEFAVNLPKALAQVRVQTYADYAWPAPLGALYQRNGLTVALALAGGIALFLCMVLWLRGTLWHAPLAGNFYAIFPHNLLATMFGSVFGAAVLALGIGIAKFWKNQASKPDFKEKIGNVSVKWSQAANKIIADARKEAALSALKLSYLDGGHGLGCNNDDDAWTHWRRRFHHLTTLGFALCFASTSSATLMHYALALQAPYAWLSLPVILGTAGGIGLLVGPAGLFWLKLRRHPQHGDAAQNPMDYGFIALLFFTSLTGLALLVWRDTGAMALLLAVHLGVVMALFITMPYGKMAHGFYRCAALLKFAIEKRMPTNLRLSAD